MSGGGEDEHWRQRAEELESQLRAVQAEMEDFQQTSAELQSELERELEEVGCHRIVFRAGPNGFACLTAGPSILS